MLRKRVDEGASVCGCVSLGVVFFKLSIIVVIGIGKQQLSKSLARTLQSDGKTTKQHPHTRRVKQNHRRRDGVRMYQQRHHGVALHIGLRLFSFLHKSPPARNKEQPEGNTLIDGRQRDVHGTIGITGA